MHPIKYLWAIKTIIYKIRFCKIGKCSYIGTPLIMEGTKKVSIGEKVRIFPGMRLEVIGDTGRIEIEDNVSIGQNFHIISEKNRLIIGANTTISANVFLTNTEHGYRTIEKHILEQERIQQDTIIGENCFIGYGSVIQAGTILGKQCIVGANSVVRGKYPDYSVIVGAPARIVRQYDGFDQWKKCGEV